MSAGQKSVTGACLCEAVSFEIIGDLRPVIGCHCVQCRKQSGHYVAATCARKDNLRLKGEEALVEYRASPDACRRFCGTCGSLLFWEATGSDKISIMAGCLDNPTGLSMDCHIFCDDKGDYYELKDGLPHFPQSNL